MLWTIIKIVGAVVLLGAIIVGVFVANQLTSTSVKNDVTFTIQEGEGLKAVSARMDSEKIIKNPTVFEMTIRVTGKSNSIFAGTYVFTKDQSMKDVIDAITNVDDVTNDITVTLIEGWTSGEMAKYLQEQGLFPAEDFVDAVQTTDIQNLLPGVTYAFLGDKPPSQGLEGYLFPDTYRIKQKPEPADVVRKLLDNFDSKLTNTMRSDIHKQGRTVFDVVVLASILEREVLSDADKKNAADVFLKRLQIGMPLQSDATVNYVTGKQDTRPTLQDIEVNSSYNTYLYKGLPPGPISNPGLSSLEAAVYPTSNPYYYFLTKDNGEAVFSRNLDEHNLNKAKYLAD